VIGTAGDRNDLSLRELGRIAATRSDYVIAKGTKKYLRGRDPEALMTLYAEGARLAGSASYSEADTELAAVKQALTMSAPGDAIAIMAQEEFSAIRDYLAAVGATPA
jgi:UDP-N-acetylmuramyl tripeptide synthase